MSDFNQRLLIPGQRGPLTFEPEGERDLAAFVSAHSAHIEASLLEHGALLFRGFDVASVEDFERAGAAISPNALEYTYRSTPRTSLGKGVFTTTEYPPDQEIALHCENAYQRAWPRKIAFCCLVAPDSGGATQIADVRKVTASLDPALIERFYRLGVRYVRHYRPYVDIPWETVFQTSDRNELADFCVRNGIEHDWLDGNTLRTVQTNQGLATHPVTGERVFFNQAHLFHISNLPADVVRSLRTMYGDRVPRNTFYGDGSEIPAADLQAVREAFKAAEMSFPWRVGDVMLLDNMQMAHGRKPFRGNRKVVAMLLDAHAPGGTRELGDALRTAVH
ncbi:TauD/TfdA family dioxygenase [Marilutibacter chinensis]|uniref:TauD/TfdA family dioxygenase n=1 Tax=Marilutibacter chinensis TaxID=2912247 RepID=A0ABS9HWP7_9GAMM|nr:TauD/TfdA family dioxygenase [Lysobacter chinensis]MCF7223314.1 TauD/TfdA family dioxygenase [Lysobacter chinensis]